MAGMDTLKVWEGCGNISILHNWTFLSYCCEDCFCTLILYWFRDRYRSNLILLWALFSLLLKLPHWGCSNIRHAAFGWCGSFGGSRKLIQYYHNMAWAGLFYATLSLRPYHYLEYGPDIMCADPLYPLILINYSSKAEAGQCIVIYGCQEAFWGVKGMCNQFHGMNRSVDPTLQP